MSYVILAAQFQQKLVTKIQNFLIVNYNHEEIEFNEQSSCYIDEGHDDTTHVILTGINEDLTCLGYYESCGEELDFDLSDLSIMELSVIMDNLLEGKFKILITK